MARSTFQELRNHISQRVLGMDRLVENLLICLLADGHGLLEGMPGLAKTTAVKTLAEAVEGDFHRIQFTPDLLPSDVIGTDIFVQQQGKFEFRRGPIFHNLVLADEINRAPAKVQSALLEAMAEHQVSVGLQSYKLPDLFMVLATQNPVEQEGTYPLPEAQLDRFLMYIRLDYPDKDTELKILELDHALQQKPAEKKASFHISQQDVFAARREVQQLYIDDKVKRYIVDLTQATRKPAAYDNSLKGLVRFGASPRATLGIARAASALAWMSGDTYVTPDHIQRVAPEILRHRILLSFEAEADNVTTDQVIARLVELVAVA